MNAVADVLDVITRQHRSTMQEAAAQRRERLPLPDAELVADIGALVAELPTDGHARCMRS